MSPSLPSRREILERFASLDADCSTPGLLALGAGFKIPLFACLIRALHALCNVRAAFASLIADSMEDRGASAICWMLNYLIIPIPIPCIV